MTLERLGQLLDRFGRLRLLVIGDFFLDQYWVIDPALAETSLETGLTAHQVIEVRCAPGAAGTVANNLCALGTGSVSVLGLTGNDGNGHELRSGLERRGANTSALLPSPDRLTPVYAKPMFRAPGGEVEGERFDLKNRSLTPDALQWPIVESMQRLVSESDGVTVMDQVEEAGCGVLTPWAREELRQLAIQFPRKAFLADSRRHLGEFRGVMLKANRAEALAATGVGSQDPEGLCRALFRLTGRAAFLTLGSEGIAVFDGNRFARFPAVPVDGPLDPVGAGDSVSAALTAALAAGASVLEGVQLGLLAAAVTIRQLGTTGTASPAEILEAATDHLPLLAAWDRAAG